jgi:vacuole morphology and inheritance protein 14
MHRKYLSDPTDDVRNATENLLGELLHEIQEITLTQRAHAQNLLGKRDGDFDRRTDGDREKLPDITMTTSERAEFLPEYDEESVDDESRTPVDERYDDADTRDTGG